MIIPERTSHVQTTSEPLSPSTCIVDTRYVYRGYFGALSICRLRIYVRPAAPPVVVASELADNPGTSITNRAEHLAAEVIRAYLPDFVGTPIRWIEHYHYGEPCRRGKTDTYDEVVFARYTPERVPCPGGSEARLGSPTWSPLTEDDVYVLCGEVPT